MVLNDVRVLGKEELLKKLKQSGYSDVAQIIEDKDIDGEKFIELREFETFKWRLSPPEKKSLWTCIWDLKANPSLLTTKEKPNVSKKTNVEPADSKAFKKSLAGFLGNNVKGSLSLPNRYPNKPTLPPKSQSPDPFVRSRNQPGANFNKPPAPVPVEPKDNRVAAIKKPIPRPVTEYAIGDDYYVDMHPPKHKNSEVEEYDGYLEPYLPKEHHYEAPPDVRRKNFPGTAGKSTYNNVSLSPRLPQKNVNMRHNSAMADTGAQIEDYEPVPTLPKLPFSNSQKNMLAERRSEDNKRPSLNKKFSSSPRNIVVTINGNRKYLGENIPNESQKQDGFDTDDKKSNTSGSKENEENGDVGTLLAPPVWKSNVTKHNERKTSLKDLENIISIIDDKGANQEKTGLSTVTKAINNLFKKRFKGEERHDIMPAITQRPLPNIPFALSDDTEEREDSIFAKPFPIPRENVPSTNPQGYITVISPKSEMGPIEDEDEAQIYENWSKGRTLENKSPLATIKKSHRLPCPDPDLFNVKHEAYIATVSPKSQMEPIEDEDGTQIYGNWPKGRTLKNKNPQKPHRLPHPDPQLFNMKHEESETYDNIDRKTAPLKNENSFISAEITSGYSRRNFAERSELNLTSMENVEDGSNDSIYENIAVKNEQKTSGVVLKPGPNSDPSSLNFTVGRKKRAEGRFEPVKTIPQPEPRPTLELSSLAQLLSQKLKERQAHLQTKGRDETAASTPSYNSDDTFSETESDEQDNYLDIDEKPSIQNKPLPEPPTTIGNRFLNVPNITKPFRPEDDDDHQAVYGNVEQASPERPLPPIVDRTVVKNKINEVFKRNLETTSNDPFQLQRKKNYERYTSKNEGKIAVSPPNSPKPESGDGSDTHIFDDVNKQPFYRNVDRREARQLLLPLATGAFLLRPSQTYFLVLTIKYGKKIYNFGIERMGNKIRLNAEVDSASPQFSSLNDFIEYFTREPITFQHRNEVMEIYLKKLLPPK